MEAAPSLETLCVESVVKQALAQPLAAEAFSDEILALALQLRRSDPKEVLLDDVVCFTYCNHNDDYYEGKSINLPFRLLPDFVQILVRAYVENDDTHKRKSIAVELASKKSPCFPDGEECVHDFMDMRMDDMDVVAFGKKYEVNGDVCDRLQEDITRYDWDEWVGNCGNTCFKYSMYFLYTYVFDQPERANWYFDGACNTHAHTLITRELKDAIHLARNDVKPDALLQRVPVLTIELISD